MAKAKHPMQPLIVDEYGVIRFKANAIVRYLLDSGPFDLNKIALLEFTREDQEQFAQLIGYSVCGFSELDYTSKKARQEADDKSDPLLDKALKRQRRLHREALAHVDRG